MRAEILSVGTELLLGDSVNTNAAEIGGMFAAAGIECVAQTTVGDNEARIADAVRSAMARADAIVITGGLGPTQDDVTREALCAVTGSQMIFDASIAEGLRERFRVMGREMPQVNLRQAERPDGSTLIPAVGTAPGLIVEAPGTVIFALPGVPGEMRAMMRQTVLPELRRRAGVRGAIVSRVLRIVGPTESQISSTLAPLWDELEGSGVTMAFLASGGEIRVRLTVRAEDAGTAGERTTAAERRIRDGFGAAVVGADDETLESVIGALLRRRSWTLACAESLTGGLVGWRITTVPGASDYFRGSLVAYATQAKLLALGVPDEVLGAHGPVSVAVAAAMASGARTRLRADVGLALTGVAGPAEQGAPVGEVIVAVDGPLGSANRTLRLPGDRDGVRRLAATAGMNMLRLYLMEALS